MDTPSLGFCQKTQTRELKRQCIPLYNRLYEKDNLTGTEIVAVASGFNYTDPLCFLLYFFRFPVV